MNTVHKWNVVCLAVALAVVVVRGAIVRDDAVEYAVSDSQLAFWSARSSVGTPVLLTFPVTATGPDVLPVLASRLMGDAQNAAAASCRLVSTSSNIILMDGAVHTQQPVAQLLFQHQLKASTQQPQEVDEDGNSYRSTSSGVSLHCGATGKWELIQFVPPTAPPSDRPWLGTGTRPYPNINADLMAATFTGLTHWVTEFLEVHWGAVHPFNTWPAGESGRFNLNTGAPLPVSAPGQSAFDDSDSDSDAEVRLALAADWGSGTQESAYVAALMTKNYEPQWTVHIGDVYYLGAKADMDSNVFGRPPEGVTNGVTWPHGSLGSFALMGNHEMYSRGYGYFDYFLPTLGVRNESGVMAGQSASYFSLENDYWRVISLDTGYNTYSPLFESDDNPQPEAVITWLKEQVKLDDPTDTRGIILFSHHQPFTAFDSKDKYPATPRQIAALVPANRTILWLFGHEHRVSFYDRVVAPDSGEAGLAMYTRCVGNGGFPTSLAPIPNRAQTLKLSVYDDRFYQSYDGFWNATYGWQGFSQLNFTGPSLTIDYRSLKFEADGHTLSSTDSDLLVTESWSVDGSGSVVQDSFTVVDPHLTIVNP